MQTVILILCFFICVQLWGYKKGGCVEGRRQSARVALKRKIESEAEASCRKEQNKLSMSRKRSLESPQEASCRQQVMYD